MAYRILIAGLFHETHTFLDEPTTEGEFLFLEGASMIARRAPGSPLDGVLEVAGQCGWSVLPGLDVRAMPSGIAPRAVFERFWRIFEHSAQQAG
ncbi:MAG: M81 family metallopeptidase [Verrucomicrobia bacterium]|nr:M81 family metallopeptidase [Verrucomicrobiota bacterium]